MRAMLTVRQLIETLQALPESDKGRIVYMEGCDCYGLWNGSTEHHTSWEYPNDDGVRVDVQGLLLGRDP